MNNSVMNDLLDESLSNLFSRSQFVNTQFELEIDTKFYKLIH